MGRLLRESLDWESVKADSLVWATLGYSRGLRASKDLQVVVLKRSLSFLPDFKRLSELSGGCELAFERRCFLELAPALEYALSLYERIDERHRASGVGEVFRHIGEHIGEYLLVLGTCLKSFWHSSLALLVWKNALAVWEVHRLYLLASKLDQFADVDGRHIVQFIVYLGRCD